jgi:proteasome lid subunit RPN8/RPN11
VAQEPTRRFEVDPRALLDVQRRARSGGPALAAVYHSHPSGGAALSAADRASLLLDDGAPVLPGVDLLVVGLGEGRAEEVRLHRWSAPGAFSEVARAVLSRTSGEGARWVISAKLP